MLECEDVGQHLLGERTQFDVAFLGSPPQQVERGVGADAVDVHQHAFCLFDGRSVSAISNRAWLILSCRSSLVGDVEVEALGSDPLRQVGQVLATAGATTVPDARCFAN